MEFGRLKVVSFSHKQGVHRCYNCLCECGKTKAIMGASLRDGRTKSCGCFMIENATTHGLSRTRTYTSWQSMRDRCYNKSYSRYYDYGGRGIRVCDEWKDSFEKFLEEMGERPKGTSLDRIDNNGDYCKSNCKWSTPKEQAKNRRPAKLMRYLNNGHP